MKQMINKMTLVSILIFIFTGCVKEELPFVDTHKDPNSAHIAFNMDALDFSSQKVLTRSGAESYVALELEKTVTDIYVFVFSQGTSENHGTDGEILEMRKVIYGNVPGQTTKSYYAKLKPRSEAVRVIGLANIPAPVWEKANEILTINTDAEGDDPTVTVNDAGSEFLVGGMFTYGSLLKLLTQIQYSTKNNETAGGTHYTVLKKDDSNSDLMIYSKAILLDKLDQATIDAKNEKIKPEFAYTRIDLMLSDNREGMELTEYFIVNPVSTYSNPLDGKIASRYEEDGKPARSHTVVPENATNTNTKNGYGKYPDDLTADKYYTHFLRGLYTYPTAPLEGTPAEGYDNMKGAATYIVFGLKKNICDKFGKPIIGGGFETVYYKVMIEYMHSKDKKDNKNTFFLYNNDRLLINLKDVSSPGYPTRDEAEKAPPSNISYEISVNEGVSNVMSNGQYYFGIEKANYEEFMTTKKSNLAYDFSKLSEADYVASEANSSWTMSADRVSCEFEMSVFAGNETTGHPEITGDQLTIEASTEDGEDITAGNVTPINKIKLEYLRGTDKNGNPIPSENWRTTFGTHRMRISMPTGKKAIGVKFRVGELTRTIRFGVSRVIETDYTDHEFVNVLTKGNEDTPASSYYANSYIIKSTESEIMNIYYIPVDYRISQFWNTYASPSKAVDFAKWGKEDSPFSLELSWWDGGRPTHTGSDPAYDPSKQMKFEQHVMQDGTKAIKISFMGDKVTAAQHQNFAINVRDNSGILWTWHLWVTDYNPYRDSNYATPTAGSEWSQVASQGNNGHLQRYGGSAWTGDYKGKFIMDRNLGSRVATGDWQNIELYYQVGRKDPFPKKMLDVISLEEMNKNADPGEPKGSLRMGGFTTTTKGDINWLSTAYYATIKSFTEVTNNPKVFVSSSSTGNGWMSEGSGTSSGWCDNYVTPGSNKKSIFDPSPIGWMIPYNKETWRGIVDAGASVNVLAANKRSDYVRGGMTISYPRSGVLAGKVASTVVPNQDTKFYSNLSLPYGRLEIGAFSISSNYISGTEVRNVAFIATPALYIDMGGLFKIAEPIVSDAAKDSKNNTIINKPREHAYPIRPVQE